METWSSVFALITPFEELLGSWPSRTNRASLLKVILLAHLHTVSNASFWVSFTSICFGKTAGESYCWYLWLVCMLKAASFAIILAFTWVKLPSLAEKEASDVYNVVQCTPSYLKYRILNELRGFLLLLCWEFNVCMLDKHSTTKLYP